MLLKVIVFMFILNLTNIEGLQRTGWPGYDYYPSLRGWLKLHKEPTDYQDARVNCHLEDALMAAEWNSDFKKALIGILSSLNDKSIESSALYSGTQVAFSDGVYKYVKGEPRLSIGTDLKGVDRCIVFTGNGSSEEVDCQEQFPYVCYAPMSDCGEDENLGYKYASETGNCYKFHTEKLNWAAAYKACREEGAYLAIVNSGAEAQVLKGLFPSDNSYKAAIGFYYWKPANSWLTIHGETIQEAGFSTWLPGEPTVNAYRGFITKAEGKLYSRYHAYAEPFICEKEPSFNDGSFSHITVYNV